MKAIKKIRCFSFRIVRIVRAVRIAKSVLKAIMVIPMTLAVNRAHAPKRIVILQKVVHFSMDE